MQHVEQLAFVFVHTFDLDVKQTVRIHDDARTAGHQFRQAAFILLLGQSKGILKLGFIGQSA